MTFAPARATAPTMAALTGTTVTEAHTRYCAGHGHATHTADGVAQPHCPRCGAVREPSFNDAPVTNGRLTVGCVDESNVARPTITRELRDLTDRPVIDAETTPYGVWLSSPDGKDEIWIPAHMVDGVQALLGQAQRDNLYLAGKVAGQDRPDPIDAADVARGDLTPGA